jgi:hypothetical protein
VRRAACLLPPGSDPARLPSRRKSGQRSVAARDRAAGSGARAPTCASRRAPGGQGAQGPGAGPLSGSAQPASSEASNPRAAPRAVRAALAAPRAGAPPAPAKPIAALNSGSRPRQLGGAVPDQLGSIGMHAQQPPCPRSEYPLPVATAFSGAQRAASAGCRFREPAGRGSVSVQHDTALEDRGRRPRSGRSDRPSTGKARTGIDSGAKILPSSRWRSDRAIERREMHSRPGRSRTRATALRMESTRVGCIARATRQATASPPKSLRLLAGRPRAPTASVPAGDSAVRHWAK